MQFSLLAEKRKELGDAAAKLRNGLDKIDETRAKVANLTARCQLTSQSLN